VTFAYVPDRGDLVWLEFTSPIGSEQAGRRPALVMSPKVYNAKVGLALFCPVTFRVNGYPFEALLPEGGGVNGVVLADQLKSLAAFVDLGRGEGGEPLSNTCRGERGKRTMDLHARREDLFACSAAEAGGRAPRGITMPTVLV
jgi:mRNA interferase MazF